jgi:SAM-dependent methyltransferase
MTAPPKIFTPEYYERMRALESDGWWNAGMRDVAGMLLRDARLPARGRLLDVGCGSGQTAIWFSSLFPEWEAAGLDVAPEGLAAAKASGVEVTRASALEIPHPDATFDAIITLDVVQHLPLRGGDQQALAEMRRVLKPAGTLFVRTNANAFPKTGDDEEFMFHRYEPVELRDKLRANGFEVLRLSRINALLGLAEIPREMRAGRTQHSSYHGILATPRPRGGIVNALKRAWLRLEGRVVTAGVELPLGRTIVALCRAA